jgi:hypothetical protein
MGQCEPGVSGNPDGRPKGSSGGRVEALAALDVMLAKRKNQQNALRRRSSPGVFKIIARDGRRERITSEERKNPPAATMSQTLRAGRPPFSSPFSFSESLEEKRLVTAQIALVP